MDTISTSHGGELQPSSVLGLRSAMVAVLRQCALQTLVEILTLHQGERVRRALKSWWNTVRKLHLQQRHARSALEASRASDRLAEKHEGNVTQLRKEWKHARQALMQSQQHEMNDDELQKLRDLDKRYRRQMAEMHDSHEELQGEHRSAHDEAQTMCKKDIKVMAMGVLESLASQRQRGGDWPQGDSASVCFMQWAFTQNPEAWCPLPPARDLKHAMVLSEQRSQLAFSLHQLQQTLSGLPQALRAAAAKERHPKGDRSEELIPQQTAVAARLLRRALQNLLWRRLGCFLHRLIGLRPLPRSSHPSAGAPAGQSGQAARDGRRSVARQGAARSAFFLGEDFRDIQRSPPTTAHELHGTQSLRDAKASKAARPKMQTEDAALKIQSVERGRRARKSMKMQMQAALSPPVASERPERRGTGPAEIHGAVVEQPPPSHLSHLPALPPVPLKVQEAAATKIQAHLRGRLGRKVVAQQKKKVFSRRSALKLIAAKPGPSGSSSPAPQVTDEKRTPSKAAAVPRMRRSVSAKRPDNALEDEPSPEEASMGHLPPPPEVLHTAAVKIQSAARGHQGRQKAAALAAQRKEQAPENYATEEAEEEDLESDEEYSEARRVTHLGPALTE